LSLQWLSVYDLEQILITNQISLGYRYKQTSRALKSDRNIKAIQVSFTFAVKVEE